MALIILAFWWPRLVEGTRQWKLMEAGESGLPWPQSAGVKMSGPLCLEMGCLCL